VQGDRWGSAVGHDGYRLDFPKGMTSGDHWRLADLVTASQGGFC